MVIICKICNKEYKTYSSRSNHIKRYHDNNVNIQDTNVVKVNKNVNQPDVIVNQEEEIEIDDNNKLTCKICDKKYNNRQALWKHNKKCKPDNENPIFLLKKQLKEKEEELKEELKKKDEEFKKELEKFKKEMMDIMNKQCKVH